MLPRDRKEHSRYYLILLIMAGFEWAPPFVVNTKLGKGPARGSTRQKYSKRKLTNVSKLYHKQNFIVLDI